jgi:sugar lactone lactonase YvrE
MSVNVSNFCLGLSGPYGLVFDSIGNLYCSNFSNSTISIITTSGIVTPFVSSLLNGPYGLTIDKNGNLYCVNVGTSSISKISTIGNVTPFVNSGLSAPRGLAIDNNGNLYCSNSGNNTISKISTIGIVTPFVNSGLNGPYGLAIDNNENLYCSNTGNNTILKYPISSPSNVTTFTSQLISGPQGLACDNIGNLYCSNVIANTIIKISTNGTVTSLVNTSLSSPRGLAFDTSGYLYCANNSNNTIVKTTTSLYPYPCFKEGSKILTDKGYINIENLIKGDLIKTLRDGYKPITMIGKREIFHIASKERIKDQLYQCSSNEFPEVFEPLIITGCHSILLENSSNIVNAELIEKVIEVNGGIFLTDDKLRLPACIDEKTTVYDTAGTYTIYHFALEHKDKLMNYGVYANGLLVETCSERNLNELSGMELLN